MFFPGFTSQQSGTVVLCARHPFQPFADIDIVHLLPVMVFSLASVFDALREYRHPAGVLDYNLGYLWTFMFALTLTTPHTSGYKLFRRAIAAPVIVVGWLYFAWVPYIANDSEQWGVTLLMSEPSVGRPPSLDDLRTKTDAVQRRMR